MPNEALEIARSLTPIALKAGAAATARALGLSAENVWSVVSRRRLRTVLRKATAPVPIDLSETDAMRVLEFLSTPDFSQIAFELAAIKVASSRRQQARLRTALTATLEASLVANGAIGPDNGRVVAERLIGELDLGVTKTLEELGAPGSLKSRPLVPVLVKTASSRAEAIVRNGEFLAGCKSLADYHTFAQEFKDSVKGLNSGLRVPHTGNKKVVGWRSLYVQPKLVPASRDGTNDEDSSTTEPRGEPHRYLTFELEDILNSNLRTVILGDPGGGKSTLSSKVAYDLATGVRWHHRATVPFLVILRDFAPHLATSKKTLVSHLEALCRDPYGVEPPEGAVEYLLLNGRAVVILDGLDELIDVSLRSRVVLAVEAFANRFPMTQILVTSRRVGYDKAPLNEELFPIAGLAQFSASQVADYARKWFRLDETHLRHERDGLASAFLGESELVADLRSNPLLLSLMCGIYAAENYIPRNRPEIYEKCAVMLFDLWDKQRGIKVPLAFNAHIRRALQSLALWLYSDQSRQEGLTRDRLTAYMTEYLHGRRFESEDEAEDAAESFIDFCTGRAWVLADVGSSSDQPIYAFTHRTFMEYFAASQLTRLHTNASALYEELRSHISLAEWDVVCQLALQILGAKVEDGADDFLMLLVQDAERLPDHSLEKVSIVSFLTRALAFVVVRPAVVRRIVVLSYHLDPAVANAPSSHRELQVDSSPSHILANVLQATPENLPVIEKSIDEITEQCVEGLTASALGSAPPDRRARISQALIVASYVDELGTYGTAVPSDLYETHGLREHWRSVRRRWRTKYDAKIRIVSDFEDWAATTATVMGTRSTAELLKVRGSQFLFETFTVPGIGGPSLAAYLLYRMRDPGIYYYPYSDDLDVEAVCRDVAGELPAMHLPWAADSLPRYASWASLGRSQLMKLSTEMRSAYIVLGLPYMEDWVFAVDDDPRAEGTPWEVIPQPFTPLVRGRLQESYRRYALGHLERMVLLDPVRQFASDWVRARVTLTQRAKR